MFRSILNQKSTSSLVPSSLALFALVSAVGCAPENGSETTPTPDPDGTVETDGYSKLALPASLSQVSVAPGVCQNFETDAPANSEIHAFLNVTPKLSGDIPDAYVRVESESYEFIGVNTLDTPDVVALDNASQHLWAVTDDAGKLDLIVCNNDVDVLHFDLQLTAKDRVKADALEPNNDFSSATPLNLGEVKSELTLEKYDFDDFSFVLPEAGFVKISADMSDALWIGNLDLADESGRILHHQEARNGDELLIQKWLPAGKYILEFFNNGEGGQYAIQVESLNQGSNAGGHEPNDSYDTATAIELGQQISSEELSQGDLDGYRFELKEAGNVTVNYQFEVSANSGLFFAVVDEANNFYDLAWNMNLWSENSLESQESSTTWLEAGTYYVAFVQQFTDNVHYSFNVTAE